jgi:hypothetical protein
MIKQTTSSLSPNPKSSAICRQFSQSSTSAGSDNFSSSDEESYDQQLFPTSMQAIKALHPISSEYISPTPDYLYETLTRNQAKREISTSNKLEDLYKTLEDTFEPISLNEEGLNRPAIQINSAKFSVLLKRRSERDCISACLSPSNI